MTLEQLLIEDYNCLHPLLEEPRRRREEGDDVRYLSRYGQRYYSKLVKTLYDLATVVPEAFPLELAHATVAALDDIATGNNMEALRWPEWEKKRGVAEMEGAKR